MKKMFLMMLAMVMSVATMNAQHGQKKYHHPMATELHTEQQAGILAKEMHLSPAETARFTKIYTEYKKESRELRKHNAGKKHDVKHRQRNQQKHLALDAKYRKQFAKVLTDKQVSYVMNHRRIAKNPRYRGTRADMHRMHRA